jgi:hypothetical protein
MQVSEVPRVAGAGDRGRHRPRVLAGGDRAAAALAGAEDAVAPPAPVAGPCTGPAETLALCAGRPRMEPDLDATRAATPVTDPAPHATPVAPAREARPAATSSSACDQARAVLGLCGTP